MFECKQTMCVLLFAVVCCYVCIMCSKCTLVNCFLKIFLKNPTLFLHANQTPQLGLLDICCNCGANTTHSTQQQSSIYSNQCPGTVGQQQHAHKQKPRIAVQVFLQQRGASTTKHTNTTAPHPLLWIKLVIMGLLLQHTAM